MFLLTFLHQFQHHDSDEDDEDEVDYCQSKIPIPFFPLFFQVCVIDHVGAQTPRSYTPQALRMLREAHFECL